MAIKITISFVTNEGMSDICLQINNNYIILLIDRYINRMICNILSVIFILTDETICGFESTIIVHIYKYLLKTKITSKALKTWIKQIKIISQVILD